MANTDLRETGSALPALDSGIGFKLTRTVSFVTYNCDDGDTVQIFKLPANCLVTGVVEVNTGEGATCTIEMTTDETTPQTLLTGASIQTAGTLSIDGADGDAAHIFLHTEEACTVTIETNHDDTDAAVIVVRLLVLDLS